MAWPTGDQKEFNEILNEVAWDIVKDLVPPGREEPFSAWERHVLNEKRLRIRHVLQSIFVNGFYSGKDSHDRLGPVYYAANTDALKHSKYHAWEREDK